jgi:hypothetical protein
MSDANPACVGIPSGLIAEAIPNVIAQSHSISVGAIMFWSHLGMGA